MSRANHRHRAAKKNRSLAGPRMETCNLCYQQFPLRQITTADCLHLTELMWTKDYSCQACQGPHASKQDRGASYTTSQLLRWFQANVLPNKLCSQCNIAHEACHAERHDTCRMPLSDGKRLLSTQGMFATDFEQVEKPLESPQSLPLQRVDNWRVWTDDDIAMLYPSVRDQRVSEVSSENLDSLVKALWSQSQQ